MIGLDRSTHYHYVQVERVFFSPKALLHMLFHILGRYHEHERADRGKYIHIIKQNVIEGITIIYAFTYIIHTEHVYAFVIYAFTSTNISCYVNFHSIIDYEELFCILKL